MSRKRPIFESFGREQPAFAVRLHDKRIAAGMSIHAACTRWRRIVRRFTNRKVRYIVTCPFLLLLVPPDIFLAFRPRAPLGISRGAIIQNAPVGGPRIAPLQEGIAVCDARRCTVIAGFW